jgi:hypothetical protein
MQSITPDPFDNDGIVDPFDENIIITGADGQVSAVLPQGMQPNQDREIDPTAAVGFILSIGMIAVNNPLLIPEQCREDAFRGVLRALDAIGVPPGSILMGGLMARQYAEKYGEPVHHLG